MSLEYSRNGKPKRKGVHPWKWKERRVYERNRRGEARPRLGIGSNVCEEAGPGNDWRGDYCGAFEVALHRTVSGRGVVGQLRGKRR